MSFFMASVMGILLCAGAGAVIGAVVTRVRTDGGRDL